MNKIGLIIKREFLTRVKKRSFLIMTFLGPILMAALWIVPFYLSTIETDTKVITVLDETHLFEEAFIGEKQNMRFIMALPDLETAKQNLLEAENYALLYVPKPEANLPNAAVLYSDGQVSVDVKNYIETTMKRYLEDQKLMLKGIDANVLKSIETQVFVSSVKLGSDGEEKESSVEVNMILGMFSALAIYMFIFLYGSQVMRGVIEEKTSRVVEIIVSSVRPFQLMLGKIVGIALVGLTQFLLWVIFTLLIITVFQSFYADELSAMQEVSAYTEQGLLPQQAQAADPFANVQDGSLSYMIKALQSIDFTVVISAFLFFFMGGYLLYAALFAAIGSAVDSEADTQQFMLPITIPLILSIVVASMVIKDPGGQVAFWMSIFPFTSPVVMMLRIPFGVPIWEVVLSASLLIAGFVFTTWIAGRIYRVGILMYGTKVNYKELWKWFFYKV